MQRASKSFEYHVYSGAPHAFFNDTRNSYRSDAAAETWQRVLGFLHRYLKSASSIGKQLTEAPMANRKFSLVTRISTDNPQAVKRVLQELVSKSSITRTEEGFLVKAELKGASARELNRTLLSTLRRIERKRLGCAQSGPLAVRRSVFSITCPRGHTRADVTWRRKSCNLILKGKPHGENRRDLPSWAPGCAQTL